MTSLLIAACDPGLTGESVRDVIDITVRGIAAKEAVSSLLVLFDEFGKYTELLLSARLPKERFKTIRSDPANANSACSLASFSLS